MKEIKISGENIADAAIYGAKTVADVAAITIGVGLVGKKILDAGGDLTSGTSLAKAALGGVGAKIASDFCFYAGKKIGSIVAEHMRNH